MADLRYRHARTKADAFGQVFTPDVIANLLVETLAQSGEPARSFLDLGAGAGALTNAVQRAYPSAQATMIEVDAALVRALRRETSTKTKRKVVRANVISTRWAPTESFDWIVSNPPFGHLEVSEHELAAIRDAGIGVMPEGHWVRGDVAFLAKAWALARRGTGLGLIVASPIICDSSQAPLRRVLANEISNLTVTALPETVFSGAQVRAHLLSGYRAMNRRRRVLLRKADADGQIVDEMSIEASAASTSLDIDHHRALSRLGVHLARARETLASVGATIQRGSRSNADYLRLGLSAFHTSDLGSSGTEVRLQGSNVAGHQVARSGDILIARVGTRCLTRQSRVREGQGLFTDSVYRVHAPEAVRERIWQTISSDFGKEWRLAHASGSCAKHLTVETLARMPLLTSD